MSVMPITALPPAAGMLVPQALPVSQAPAVGHGPTSFAHMIEQGVETVNDKVTAADREVRAFVLDDSIPVHQVSFALEQARFSLELMLQVRGRLVEGYQQLMNMQL